MANNQRAARIVTVVAGTMVAINCGANYGFSAWAPQFAERLQLSATQINLVGNFGNLGMYAMGIPGGLLIDTRGPRWGVALGIICFACGYFPLKWAYDAGVGSVGMVPLCLFALMTGMGSSTAFAAAIKVCASNWPGSHGTATGFPLSAFGLSAFFYTTLAAYVFPDDTSGYLLLLALGTTAIPLVAMFFLRLIPPHYETLPHHDDRAGHKRKDSDEMRGMSTADRSATKRSSHASGGPTEETASLMRGHRDHLDESREGFPARSPAPPSRRADITGWKVLRTSRFWQLFVMLSLLCGVGLMTINNIGNNARSLWRHYDDSASREFIQNRQLMHVSLLSFCSFAGRLTSGVGSDWLVHRQLSRYWALVVSACAFVAAQVLALALVNPHHLFLLSACTGLAYGVLFGVFPALVVDAFGPSGLALNWGCMTWAPVLSGNLFNLAYGAILDRHSHLQSRPDDGSASGPPADAELVCDDGNACYHDAYYLTLCASLVGVLWSLFCIRQERAESRKRRQPSGSRHPEP